MRSAWFSRLFFVVVAVVALGGVLSGTGCTRWGQPGPITPTLAPISALFVDANSGSDTSGNGSQLKPYKTLTKAVGVIASSKNLSTTGVTITLLRGDYNAANGEKFPIVIPTSVTLSGPNFTGDPRSGAFVDGVGQDTLYEKLLERTIG